MGDANELISDFQRYAAMIAPALAAGEPLAWPAETPLAVQVERGAVFPMCLSDPQSPAARAPAERLIELARDPASLASIAVVDASGHRRSAYPALLVDAWLQAYRLIYETIPQGQFGRWEEALRTWCDGLESDLGAIRLPDTGMPAARGGEAARLAWTALALHVAGKVFIRDAWTDLAAGAMGSLARAQQESGAFLIAGASDNPETHWYHELVVLGAMASFAVQAEDRTIASAVQRASRFHLSETQPDHASSEPWGLFAFIWNPDTRSLADQLLHAATIVQAGRRGGLTLMLLADALYCLRLFL